jgi:hypothetical protein
VGGVLVLAFFEIVKWKLEAFLTV